MMGAAPSIIFIYFKMDSRQTYDKPFRAQEYYALVLRLKKGHATMSAARCDIQRPARCRRDTCYYAIAFYA